MATLTCGTRLELSNWEPQGPVSHSATWEPEPMPFPLGALRVRMAPPSRGCVSGCRPPGWKTGALAGLCAGGLCPTMDQGRGAFPPWLLQSL